jgi:hypothetical protein
VTKRVHLVAMVRVFPSYSVQERLSWARYLLTLFSMNTTKHPGTNQSSQPALLWPFFKTTPAEFLVLTLLQGETFTLPVMAKN